MFGMTLLLNLLLISRVIFLLFDGPNRPFASEGRKSMVQSLGLIFAGFDCPPRLAVAY